MGLPIERKDSENYKIVLDKLSNMKNEKYLDYNDFTSENADLFILDSPTNEEFYYYSFIFTKPQKKLFTFTINGEVTFSQLIGLISYKVTSNTFFNVKNYIIFDMSNNKLRHYIERLFLIPNTIFMDHSNTLCNLIGSEKLDILFFTNDTFYKLKIKMIVTVHKNIKNYFRRTELEDKDDKCHLCKSNRWEIALEKDFVLTEKFCKFCKKCLKIINQVKTY